jgi:hypothetical protein
MNRAQANAPIKYILDGQADMDAIRSKVNQSVEQGKIP